MDSSNCFKISSIILALFSFMIFVSSVCSVQSENHNNTNLQKLRPRDDEFKKQVNNAYLKKINKHAVKTIKQSPNGEIIDCVLSHLQPAFDHPDHLQGQMPMDPPEMPKWVTSHNGAFEETFQIWSKSGTCPEKTIPIRRTNEQDSVQTFRRKLVRRDSNTKSGHEHAIAFVNSPEYYGAGAIINVWAPHVQEIDEFSISQIWITAGPPRDQNTIEVGWQVNKNMYGDYQPRLFTYWTSDGYNSRGCYDLMCNGFVQISSKVALGSAIRPVSSYAGEQYDVSISVYKNITDKNWWLVVNTDFVGYWPSNLFTHLKDSASMVEFGGEIVNTRSSGFHFHTTTQMGSGHFPAEWYGRASYFRNLQVVNSSKFIDDVLGDLKLLTTNKYCYDIKLGPTHSQFWGTYFFYGGPGRGLGCS